MAININPNEIIAWIGKNFTLDELNRHGEALEAVVEISPDNSNGCKYKSYALEALGRHEEAIDAQKKASTLEQQNY